MKHIESIQPEYAAEELERIVREEGDATASAALTALLHNATGCAIPPLADTPQSEVEELVPLCLSILRRHWTTPLTALGDGTTPMSLADLMRRLILGRVDGNEAWSIPPANANIPTAVAALRQRDMSSGLTLTLPAGDGSTPTTMPLPDGLSLAQLLCSGLADNITELHDSNKGWTMTKILSVICKIFTNAETILLDCEEIDFTNNNGFIEGCTAVKNLLMPYLRIMRNHNGWYNGIAFGGGRIARLSLPNFEEYYNDHYGRLYANDNSIKYVDFPKFKHMGIAHTLYMFDNCTELLEINMPSLSSIKHNHNGYRFIRNCNKVQKVVVGQLSDGFPINGETPDLIHFQVANDYAVSLNLSS